MDVHRVHRTGSLLKGHMILPETKCDAHFLTGEAGLACAQMRLACIALTKT